MRLILVLLALAALGWTADDCVQDAEILSQLQKAAGNLLEQPRPSGQEIDDVLEISIGFSANSFNIVPHTSTVEIDGIVTRQWKHPSLYFSHLNPCRNVLSISHWRKQLWTPQLSFANSVAITVHHHSVVIRLKDDGTIIHTERVKQSIPCKTHANEYPFGNTTCTLVWRNDDLTRNNAKVKWIENSGDLQNAHEAGDLLLRGVNLTQTEAYLQNGVVDELKLNYEFTRGHHKILLLFFIPSIIFMFIPWLSLCLGPMAITRSILLIGSLILLMIHYSTNLAGLPQTNGVTAIDIWKLFSFFYVVGIMCELIIVTLMASLGRSRRCKRGKRKGGYSMEPLYEEMNDLRDRKTRRTCGCCRISALILDFAALWISAIVFLLFCFVYYSQSAKLVKWSNDFDIDTLRII
ncbi:unnamed protein product [Caenorhabditis auriculariae]|uniref:Neurotransmitter-gated ion-channel ligand-binding domain-containing protein n=1 Tax=Caenorhabditis auriculariae TaxID=2777116 RepID=A0A8S1H0N6_9PELO|nr:unnamed protein product [Caenorhabditis auriculariae]